jgi:hypothetical protein
MTALEKLKNEHPEYINDKGDSTVCPMFLDYLPKPDGCGCSVDCDDCWNREMPEEKPVIKDSGTRREFETGAVRDIQEGKGRCDLLPLDIVGKLLEDGVIKSIESFVDSGDERVLGCTLSLFNEKLGCDKYTFFLEVAKHFEEGAKKYSEDNWKKGIPTHCYIDSAVRHYLKYLRGDTDEPHDRAFVWNILCCIWTCKHKPELNDYAANAACEDSPVKEEDDK